MPDMAVAINFFMTDTAPPPLTALSAPRAVFLAPEDRIAEVLFGLIMVITFTGSLSIAEGADAREEVRTMLIGALGCNIAWGIIDGILYLMGCLAESARNRRINHAVRKAKNTTEVRRAMDEALPAALASVLRDDEYASLHARLLAQPEPPQVARLTRVDWFGAFFVFLWVFVVTFPVTIPFMLMSQVGPALRISNAIAIGLLFVLGFAYGRCIGRNRWLWAIWMVAVGIVLVAMTMALGG